MPATSLAVCSSSQSLRVDLAGEVLGVLPAGVVPIACPPLAVLALTGVLAILRLTALAHAD
ncbi:MAG: hypothetical protein WKF76_10500 [Nocardioidaceae bacterium]